MIIIPSFVFNIDDKLLSFQFQTDVLVTHFKDFTDKLKELGMYVLVLKDCKKMEWKTWNRSIKTTCDFHYTKTV